MARTVLLYVGPALLVAASWLRLEEDPPSGDKALWLAVLALLPALVRPVWGRVLAAAVVTPLAIDAAFDRSLLDARPFDDTRNFFGPFLTELKEGALRFYDVNVPFPPAEEPGMQGVMLFAIFAFCLGISLGLAARRPLVASVALVAGAVWPATLVSTGFTRGVLVLAGVLTFLAWGGRRAPHSLRPAVVAGAVLALAAIGATSSEAVAKGEFLSWKRWDPYDQPDRPVGVRYVWDANYGGIQFPEKVTTVLVVDGPRRPLYWRATTLDTFTADDDRWIEDLRPTGSSDRVRRLTDPLLPAKAREPSNWVRADVTVKALRDRHLPGPSAPVQYDPRGAGTVNYDAGGVATLPDGLRRDLRYTVWAYAPQPTPIQLAGSRPPVALRNTIHSRYLEVAQGVQMLPFGSQGRDEQLRTLLDNSYYGQVIRDYAPLYRRARELTAGAETPYAAAFTLEAWFRTQGGFTYEEQPPVALLEAPLVNFVMRTKSGYCQHFAGAMTLMLRSLGIPSRVAVGFTSGAYDASKRRWTVTDHDAHAWVEVWFDGEGWLPFDPTPGRGRVSGTYSSSSPELDTSGFEALFEGLSESPILRAELRRTNQDRLEGIGIGSARDLPGDIGALGGTVRDSGASLLRLLAVLALLALAAVALAKLVVRRSRYLTRDPRRIAAACRAELVDVLADQGIKVPGSATLADLGETVSERLYVDADAFVAAASAARFAPQPEARAAARSARRELRVVRARLRRRLSTGERVRGFVSVRSLGLTG